jgi:hypothetical protein
MHPAAEAGEMVLGVLAFAVAGEAIPGGGRGIGAPRALITRIGLEPRRLGLAGAGCEHADWRVIGEDRLGRQDMAANRIGQRFQQCGGLADPIGQGGAVQIQTFALEDLALPVKRQMIGLRGGA